MLMQDATLSRVPIFLRLLFHMDQCALALAIKQVLQR